MSCFFELCPLPCHYLHYKKEVGLDDPSQMIRVVGNLSRHSIFGVVDTNVILTTSRKNSYLATRLIWLVSWQRFWCSHPLLGKPGLFHTVHLTCVTEDSLKRSHFVSNVCQINQFDTNCDVLDMSEMTMCRTGCVLKTLPVITFWRQHTVTTFAWKSLDGFPGSDRLLIGVIPQVMMT